MSEYRIVKLVDLLPDDRNANTGTERGMQALESSLREHGAGRGGLVDKNLRVVAGNKTLEQLAAQGVEEVVVVPTDGTRWVVTQRTDVDLDSEEGRRLALADNRVSELNLAWDTVVLAELAEDMPDVAAGLWGEQEFDTLLESAALELPEPGNGGDEFEADEAAPCRVKPGDVWLIGGVHRLICGDCTDPATVERLMQGERADAVVTDPPYAIYGSSTGIGGDVVDDNMVQPFMRSLFQVVTKNTSLGAHIYVFCDWRSYASWWNVSKPFPLIVRNCIVWDKGDGGLGSMYTMRHEFVVFFEHIQKHVTMTKANATRNARMVHGRSNVQRFNVVQGKERLHNAVKPLQLIEGLIDASSDSEHIILDPFLGSGTTIIAAHRTGRRCYGCEISEAYCEVILQRCEAEGLTVERVEQV